MQRIALVELTRIGLLRLWGSGVRLFGDRSITTSGARLSNILPDEI
jgi:hypothetical protein